MGVSNNYKPQVTVKKQTTVTVQQKNCKPQAQQAQHAQQAAATYSAKGGYAKFEAFSQQNGNISYSSATFSWGQPCVQKPNINHCGAPAGRGLSKDPEGFPKGSIRTAGGYTVVPEGKQEAWSVYAPGQKHGDKPMSRIWGDPHVDVRDGSKGSKRAFDFTKDSNFVLPDGTRIMADTTSETGKSFTKGLTITNGNDAVEITGIDKNRPQVGHITPNGYAKRAQHLAQNPGMDTFRLGGSLNDPRWFKDGAGEITGSHYNKHTNRYEQCTDGSKKYWVDPNLRRPVGSPAWGNRLIRDCMVRYPRPRTYPQPQPGMVYAGGVPGFYSSQASQNWFSNPATQMGNDPFRNMFGGLPNMFGGFNQLQDTLQHFGNLFLNNASLNLSFNATRFNYL